MIRERISTRKPNLSGSFFQSARFDRSLMASLTPTSGHKASRMALSSPGDGLTYRHSSHMAFHMKTTLVIDDQIMSRLKQEAVRRNTTISQLVEAALRSFLRKPPREQALPPLPVLHGGKPLVDIADREALEDALADERDVPYRARD